MKKGKIDFEVESTIKADDYFSIFRPLYPALNEEMLQEVFDKIPIKEVREVCIHGLSKKDNSKIDWLIERTKAYLEIEYEIDDKWLIERTKAEYEIDDKKKVYICIPDDPTVLMLFKELALHRGERQPVILQLMVDTVKGCIGDSYREFVLEECTEILYKKITNQPKLYNEEVKKLLVDLLDYDNITEPLPVGNYKSSLAMGLLRCVFLIIGCVKDRFFIPFLRKNIFSSSSKDFDELMWENAIRKEYLDLEDLRMAIIYHLENH